MKDKSYKMSEGKRAAAIESATKGLESRRLNDPPERMAESGKLCYDALADTAEQMDALAE